MFWSMIFISSLKFLTSAFLSFLHFSQMVSCFMMGHAHSGRMVFFVLDVLAMTTVLDCCSCCFGYCLCDVLIGICLFVCQCCA